MQLRLLSTMAEVAAERNSTLIFPIPIELLRFVQSVTDDHANSAGPSVVVGEAKGEDSFEVRDDTT